MFKRYALGLALALICFGTISLGLDVLDIAEGDRLNLPIPILNIVFICIVAALVAYTAAKSFAFSGSFETLGLGCAAIAFGVGTLLYSLFYWWLDDAGLNARIIANEGGILIASIMHLSGAALGIAKHRLSQSEPRLRQTIVFSSYLAIVAVIAFVTWLAFHGALGAFFALLVDNPVTGSIEVRDVVRGLAVLLCIIAAAAYIRKYFESRSDFYYWYFLGLALLASGVVLISEGDLASRVAWSGRASQYVSGMYFLVSVLIVSKRARIAEGKGNQ